MAGGALNARRRAAAGFACSSGIVLVASLLFGSIYGPWALTDPDLGITTAEWVRELSVDATTRTWVWSVEALAALVVAVTCARLAAGAKAGVRWLPRRGAWAVLAKSALLHVIVLAVMLRSYYGMVAPLDERDAAGLELINGITAVLATLSAVLFLLGVGALFASELLVDRVMSLQVAWVGSAISLIGLGLLLMASTGLVPKLAPVPVLLMVRLMTVCLGARLSRVWSVSRVAG